MITELSVIIVNYNVKYFLEQALLSVKKAATGLAVQIIVIDNNSVDGSVEWLKQKFDNEILIIENKKNVGFAKANNQGIAVATGNYILLLNPDTVVSEDTFTKTLAFMNAHPNAGALGVCMYDGNGHFLPESKRGLPTPWVAFCKIFGLGAIFKHSPFFNWYYMGHLPQNEINEIEVLSGAFMLLKKEALQAIGGGLDEDFFMYGEDIDLSYKIIKQGFKNYYFPNTCIIHYKGESTKRGSLNYVRMFYNAMIIFAQKHFSSEKAKWYVIVIKASIYLSAFVSVLKRILSSFVMPILDAIMLYAGMYTLKNFWAKNIKSATQYYPAEYMNVNVPIYIIIWITSIYFLGGYYKPYKISRLVQGLLTGTLLISAVYGFLPENLRFSRALILLGMACGIIALAFFRIFVHFIHNKNFNIDAQPTKNTIIAGTFEECKRVKHLLYEVGISINLVGYVLTEPIQVLNNLLSSNANNAAQQLFLGSINQLPDIVEIYKIDEIIFCGKDIPSQQIIQYMVQLGGASVQYKIVPPESLSVIGSHSKYTAGDLYTIDISLKINDLLQKKNKRMLDIMLSIGIVLFAPIFIFFALQLLKNALKVLFNQYSWVGYAIVPTPTTDINILQLPFLKKGILSPLNATPQPISPTDTATIQRLNLLYAKNYSIATDLEIIWKARKKMNAKPI